MEPSELRRLVIQGIFVIIGGILLIQLFFMQVMDGSYEAKAKSNVVREVTVYPSRGLIFDRNRKLVVNNEAVYDLVMIPNQVKDVDTLKLCNLLEITPEEFVESVKKVRKSKGYSNFKPQVLFKQIPAEVYARLQEFLYQFPGFYSQVRAVRHYPRRNAAHVLGYIGEVNQKQIDTSDYYKLGDYIGISGIEASYENELRGERGIKYRVVDVLNREIGSFNNGKKDQDALPGEDLTLTIDIDLQAYAERLMKNKRGSLVAIEPKTGEILALVSSPNYDPNLLTGRRRGKGMKYLQSDTLKPLFNRALMAYYPPGSTFKPLMALLALQENVIPVNYYHGCYGGYRLGRLKVGCHGHRPCYSVKHAIQHSCNAYFCHIFKMFIEEDKFGNVADGLTVWGDYLNQLGLGQKLNLDVAQELKGNVPQKDLYDRMYGEGRWRASMIISLGIGQGEMGVTPLQMAHSTAVIANRGTFHYPHVVRPKRMDKDNFYLKKRKTSIKPSHFEAVVDGMERVVLAGTATVAFVQGLDICGKTGTAENPHGKDHSLFIAFAPKEKPKIAIAVIVENSGYGSRYAAPISSLVIEKHINGKITGKARKRLETKMLEANLINPGKRKKKR